MLQQQQTCFPDLVATVAAIFVLTGKNCGSSSTSGTCCNNSSGRSRSRSFATVAVVFVLAV